MEKEPSELGEKGPCEAKKTGGMGGKHGEENIWLDVPCDRTKTSKQIEADRRPASVDPDPDPAAPEGLLALLPKHLPVSLLVRSAQLETKGV